MNHPLEKLSYPNIPLGVFSLCNLIIISLMVSSFMASLIF